MPRVLIVHYHFLPVHNVAVKRLAGYARHLPAFGWEPVVMTRDWRGLDDVDSSWGLSWEPELEARAQLEIHRVPHAPVRRVTRPRADDWTPVRKMRSLFEMVTGRYPDAFLDWAGPCVDAATRLAATAPYDAILTYCPPETNHVIGSRLARRLGIPWIPFFGDLYGFFLAPLPERSPGAAIRRRVHHRWMAPAAGCIAVTPYMVDYLAQTYGKPAALVLTGFEPDDFPGGWMPPAAGERFILSHVGSLYPGDQRPELLLDGLDALLERRPDLAGRLEVRLVGSKCDDYLRARLAARPCGRFTQVRPKVSSPAAIALVRESHALLAFNCTSHRARHGTMSYPTKIFEALGAGRPILAIPPDGDWVDSLLRRTNGGTAAADPQAIAGVLETWMQSWRDTGRVACDPDRAAIEELSTPRQTAHLAAFLDAAAGGSLSSSRRSARISAPPTCSQT